VPTLASYPWAAPTLEAAQIRARQNGGVDELARDLAQHGFVWVRERTLREADAFGLARTLIAARCALDGVAPLELVGDFVLPPPDGRESRDFQTLHFDFGLPLDPASQVDLGHFSALHVRAGFDDATALTRLVPLAPLLAQRAWPARAELIARMLAYGETHGAWDHAQGYLEGSLARLLEAATGSRLLPSVKAEPGFLCGTEFDSVLAEAHFLAARGLRVDSVEIEVGLSPGELLIFDNLAVAHGRRGRRRPGELRQWVFGTKDASPAAQHATRDRMLAAFEHHRDGVATAVSVP
jgi:hypothetical protein